MKYTFVVLIILLNYVTAGFSQFEWWDAYWFTTDLQLLLGACISYALCSARRWRLKTLLLVSFATALGVVFHNLLVEYDIVPEEIPAMISLAVVATLTIFLTIPLWGIWERMPDDEIKENEYFEILDKPRSDLQFLLFIRTFGRSGSYAITNGIHIIKMSKAHGRSILLPFDESYLTSKKCIKIGGDNTNNKKLFASKIDVKFNWRRTCYWLSRGFSK